MAFTPTYGSVFVYGAAHSPDSVRLSGPAPNDWSGGGPPSASKDRWYGDGPGTDPNGTPVRPGDYGEPVEQWNSTSQPGVDPVHGLGYPSGPVDDTFVPNESWLYGVPLEDGTYTRVAKPRWKTHEIFESPHVEES